MAARPTSRIVSTTPLYNEPNNSSTRARSYRLPSGPCNYTNLKAGGTAPPRCGCQRFWGQLEHAKTSSGTLLQTVSSDQTGWCMCEHHACFHEILPPRRPTRGLLMGAPKSILSSSQHSRKDDSSLSSSHLPSQVSDYHASQLLKATMSDETITEGRRARMSEQSQATGHILESVIPDTAYSGHPANLESTAQGLPPIPSQCLLPPDVSSGVYSWRSQPFHSFPGLKPHLSVNSSVPDEALYLPQGNHDGQLLFCHTTVDQLNLTGADPANSFVGSATEVVTPSPRASPDMRLDHEFDKHITSLQNVVDILATEEHHNVEGTVPSTDHSEIGNDKGPSVTAITVRPVAAANSVDTTSSGERGVLLVRKLIPHLQIILRHVSAHPTLSTRVQNHEERLDLIENASSSYVGVQEVNEKFDLTDERTDEIESRVEELERSHTAINDLSGMGSFRRRLRHLEDGEGSMASETSSEMIAAAIERTEFSTRLESLETQFTEFQSLSSPSCAHPWKLEVVFIPFGADLKGIWSTMDQYRNQKYRNNSVSAGGWTQTQYSNLGEPGALTKNTLNRHQSLGDTPEWSGKTNDWLVARACASGSKVEARLRSRGLVKTIEIVGPSARDIQVAMLTAFADLPETLNLSAIAPSKPLPESCKDFHGLQASWIPLRKLHRDSRLRFLDDSEMVTPALWTAMFLSSSVVMRATGVKRLYITQRESYLQQAGDVQQQWTWQKLRILPRVFQNSQSSIDIREADAKEACWKWDDRLDPPQSAHSSFNSQHPSLSIRKVHSQQSKSSHSSELSSPPASPAASTTPTSVTHARVMSPLVERHRPLRLRTTSMPLMAPLKTSPPPGKRRIASFDHEVHGPTSPQTSPIRASANLALKRRRISRSPSRPRDTPRWSAGPPSPYCFEEPGEQNRGTTPFAYATPHSNAPYPDFRPHSMVGMNDYDNNDRGSTTDDAGREGAGQDANGFDSEAGHGHQPEDDAWEGVGDDLFDDDSDQERKALSVDDEDDEAMSDASSQPSEYPSTQPKLFYSRNNGAFDIYEDDGRDTSDHSQKV